ncbi:NAD(P)/FAD-dependent oxidoreductase [Falsirhodobacter algicola]|uniref:FAD-dependent oxidoreductase n=1 Tax=Falsirhodobacter algicola TaxID=2692330 RepID=A0A8J8MUL7_9RHOB|nr:FAD-dependent oxidoreductase [Falsirhodobacter algicola]QUS36757.1 FAD-dependent oxidoreductase [Falsirhodobacter algicola]
MRIIVIGAGVVGLSAALALQAEGHDVTVLDREGPAAGASAGNAGAFAFSDILPLASPGILRKAPRWLMDPLGPLSIPPAYAPRIAPWMFRFWRACAPGRVAASTAAQTALMDLSKAELEPFLQRSGTAPMLRRDGNLQLYETEAEFRAAKPGWDLRANHGIPFRHMTAEEMAELQPGLSPRFIRGTFTPDWYSIADPRLYTLALAERLVSQGGRIRRADIAALQIGARIGVDGQMADRVVIAAGAHSRRLAALAGDRVPLETERGYNTTLPPDAVDLRCQLTFGGHGFVISRLSTGIRVGGAVELGGLDRAPDFRRSDAMLAKAARFLPALRTDGGTRWMGFRPSLPDSLPVIGRARASGQVLYAFGHGHLGLTQSAGTARLIADLVAGRTPAIDPTPFSAQRF